MKVLEVLDVFYPNVDGPINVMVNIAKILNKEGVADVELLVPDNPDNRVEISGVTIHRTPSLPAPDGYQAALPWLSRKVQKLFKEGGFDLVHIHSPFTLGRYAVEQAKKYNIPSIITVHTKYKEDFSRVLKTKLLQDFMLKYIMRVINNADYCLSVSHGAADVVKSYGYTGHDVYVIRNGTDLSPKKYSDKVINSVKKKYGLEGKFVFLFVGRVVSLKNVQFSLEVMRLLKERGVSGFKFLVVGDGDYLPKLEEIVKEFNLINEVVFTGRISDRNEITKLYAASDLFLFPSTFDTCGIVVIEAAANSLPCVVIENSCPAEMIKNGVNGFALPMEASSWADNLEKIMNEKAKLSKIKNEALSSIYVNWETVAMEYYDFYAKVLSGEVAKTRAPRRGEEGSVSKIKEKAGVLKTSSAKQRSKVSRARRIKKLTSKQTSK